MIYLLDLISFTLDEYYKSLELFETNKKLVIKELDKKIKTKNNIKIKTKNNVKQNINNFNDNHNDNNNDNDNINKIIKFYYKKIVIKTHPDKCKTYHNINFFRQSKIYYDKKILIGILNISSILKIDIILTNDMINRISFEINLFNSEILKFKKSLYLIWANSNENNKKKIINSIIKKITSI
jgi:hypothetical protein